MLFAVIGKENTNSITVIMSERVKEIDGEKKNSENRIIIIVVINRNMIREKKSNEKNNVHKKGLFVDLYNIHNIHTLKMLL